MTPTQEQVTNTKRVLEYLANRFSTVPATGPEEIAKHAEAFGLLSSLMAQCDAQLKQSETDNAEPVQKAS